MTHRHATDNRGARSSLARIDDDWEVLSGSRAARRALAGWHDDLYEAGVGSVTDVGELAGVIRRPGDHVRADAVMRVLVGRAQAGDRLAARTVIQGMVPFVGRLAGQYCRCGGDSDDAVAEILAVLARRIARIELAERNRMLVAYVQLAVRRDMRRGGPQAQFRVRPEISLDDADEVAVDGDMRSAAERVAAIVAAALRAGQSTRGDAELLLMTASGHPVAVIARHLHRDRA